MCTCKNKITNTHADSGMMEHIIAVTNRRLCSRPLAEQAERVCRLHPQAVILREKDLPEAEYALLAKEIMDICRKYEVPCILHTFINTARDLGCPAIHLPLPLLRRYGKEMKKNDEIPGFQTEDTSILDNFNVIGISIHSVEEAMEAEKLGATYLTAGHIYTTDCKKGLPPRGLDFLRSVCESVSIPVYAIGGIKLDQIQMDEVMSCGAKGGCIMSGMMEV